MIDALARNADVTAVNMVCVVRCGESSVPADNIRDTITIIIHIQRTHGIAGCLFICSTKICLSSFNFFAIVVVFPFLNL